VSEEGGIAQVPFTTGAAEFSFCVFFVFERRRVGMAVFFAHINENLILIIINCMYFNCINSY